MMLCRASVERAQFIFSIFCGFYAVMCCYFRISGRKVLFTFLIFCFNQQVNDCRPQLALCAIWLHRNTNQKCTCCAKCTRYFLIRHLGSRKSFCIEACGCYMSQKSPKQLLKLLEYSLEFKWALICSCCNHDQMSSSSLPFVRGDIDMGLRDNSWKVMRYSTKGPLPYLLWDVH